MTTYTGIDVVDPTTNTLVSQIKIADISLGIVVPIADAANTQLVFVIAAYPAGCVVVDLDTQVVSTVAIPPLDGGPLLIYVAPAMGTNGHAYQPYFDTSTGRTAIMDIDLATATVARTIDIPEGPGTGIAVNYAATTLYVTQPAVSGSNDISVIDIASWSIVAQFSLTGGENLIFPYITHDDATVYFTRGDSVTVLDTATNTITTTISVPSAAGGSGPGCVLLDDTTFYYFAPSLATPSIELLILVDIATNIATTVATTDSNYIQLSETPDGKYLAFNSSHGTLYLYDIATATIAGSVFAFTFGFAIYSDSASLYAPSELSPTTTQYSIPALATIGNPPTPDGALYAVFTTNYKYLAVAVEITTTAPVIPHIFIPQKGMSTAYTAQDYVINWLALERWANSFAPTLFFPNKDPKVVPTPQQLTTNFLTMQLWIGSTLTTYLGHTPTPTLFVPIQGLDRQITPDELTTDWLAIQNWANNLGK